MKNKIIFIIIIILIVFLGFIYYYLIPKTVDTKEKEVEEVIEKTEEIINYEEFINNLKLEYNNEDIIGKIVIPDVLDEIILQTNNNDYYLNHDINKNEVVTGTVFLDYRLNINESKKLILYSHSDPEKQLPFVKLSKYNKKNFFNKHPYIYIIDSNNKRKYEIFSSYIETKDFDYINIESFSSPTYKEHLIKLKNKSLVKHKIELDEDSKILILQTCSLDTNIESNNKYQLVIAKEISN